MSIATVPYMLEMLEPPPPSPLPDERAIKEFRSGSQGQLEGPGKYG